ncbi:MAG TPA: DUF6788 family protein [Bryobacteraceae bacterium]|nr:DUF6788 family protein [Bryobacteraceae bacterium]
MKQKEVIHKRRKIAATLPAPEEVLRGSLLERTIFHRHGCSRCEAGEGHKVWVLTVTYPGGRNRQFSIRPEQRELVKRWLGNYQEWKRKMEEICELNHDWLRAEE